MAKKKSAQTIKSQRTEHVAWSGWDDAKLADLKRIVDDIRSSRFSLENLRGVWDRMPDDEIDPMVDTLREIADELASLRNDLEETRDSEDGRDGSSVSRFASDGKRA